MHSDKGCWEYDVFCDNLPFKVYDWRMINTYYFGKQNTLTMGRSVFIQNKAFPVSYCQPHKREVDSYIFIYDWMSMVNFIEINGVLSFG